jgi:hypothetical protein
MKTILACMVGLVLLAGCSQQATNSNLSEDAPASANTKSKIGVDLWASTATTVEVKGQTAAGKALRELKLTMNSDKSCNLVKNFMDASGNTVASVALKLDKDGTALSNTTTGNPGGRFPCKSGYTWGWGWCLSCWLA